jgi:hypothetical protein
VTVWLGVKNNCSTTLATGVNSIQTLWDVTNAAIFPAVPFHVSCGLEVVRVTAVDTVNNRLTVARAQEASIPADHPANEGVELRVTAQHITDLRVAVDGLSASAGQIQTDFLRRDGSAPMTGDLALGTHNITGVVQITGTSAQIGTGNFGGLVVTGQSTIANGTASAPGIRLASEQSGLFRKSASALGLAAAGVEVAAFASTGLVLPAGITVAGPINGVSSLLVAGGVTAASYNGVTLGPNTVFPGTLSAASDLIAQTGDVVTSNGYGLRSGDSPTNTKRTLLRTDTQNRVLVGHVDPLWGLDLHLLAGQRVRLFVDGDSGTPRQAVVVNEDASVEFPGGRLLVQGLSNAARGLFWNTGANARWSLLAGPTPDESSSNLGSDLSLKAYDDAGGLIGDALVVTRASRLVSIGGLAVTGAAQIAGRPLVVSPDGGNALAWRSNGLYTSGSSGNVTVLAREEFLATAGSTQLTLAQTPTEVITVARNGVLQSQNAGNYSLAGSVLTFTDAFAAGERVYVLYARGISVPADSYSTAQSDANFVNVTGDVMTGALSFGPTPSTPDLAISRVPSPLGLAINGSPIITQALGDARYVRSAGGGASVDLPDPIIRDRLLFAAKDTGGGPPAQDTQLIRGAAGVLSLRKTATDAELTFALDSPAGYAGNKTLRFNHNGVARWSWLVDMGESGSNAGGNLYLQRNSDAGGLLSNVVIIYRNTGQV